MEMTVDYTGGMSFVCKTRGHEITVDLPPSLGGQDSAPTPPDLLIASLGSCIGVYVIGYLRSQELPLDGVKVSIKWEDEKAPARIGKIVADIDLPEGISSEQAQMALKAAGMCKIHNTLHNAPEICVSVADRAEGCVPG